jgi:hypothetical protein
MTKRTLIFSTLLIALTATFFAPTLRAVAKEHRDMMAMAMQAKTPADHEKLAARDDEEATEARAKSELHKKMAEDIRKTGGAIFAKVHYDEHCDGLANHYAKVAEEYGALAKAERDMAKEKM